MTTSSVVLSTLSGIIFAVAFVPYIVAIVKQKASPKKVTWLVWSVGDIVILAGMLAQGTVSGLMIAAAIFATITFFLSLKFGKSGWTRGDKICLFLSALAIALWIYFGDSNIGIAFSIAALAIAVLPTYQSAWNDSKNEDALTWILFNISSALGVLAVMAMSDSQFADSAPAIAFLAIDFPLLYLVVIRPRLKKRNEHATSSTTR